MNRTERTMKRMERGSLAGDYVFKKEEVERGDSRGVRSAQNDIRKQRRFIVSLKNGTATKSDERRDLVHGYGKLLKEQGIDIYVAYGKEVKGRFIRLEHDKGNEYGRESVLLKRKGEKDAQGFIQPIEATSLGCIEEELDEAIRTEYAEYFSKEAAGL